MGRLLILLLSLAASLAVSAEPFAEAIAGSPALAAARLRIEAAEREAAAAGVLPDPMLGIDGGRMRGMGETGWMYGAMLEQPLPRWGERDAQRAEASARVREARAEYRAEVGEHAAGIAAALAEAVAATATAEVGREALGRIDALRAVIGAQVASGGASSLDLLAIDARRDAQELSIAVAGQRAADAQAEVRGRLGLSPEAPLPPFALPDPATIDADRQPEAERARASQEGAVAAAGAAASRGRPETSVGARWEREDAGLDSQTDKVSLALTVSLPVWRGSYDAGVEAARARERAAAHEVHAAGWMARSRIGRAQRAEEQAVRAIAAAEAAVRRAESASETVRRQVASGTAALPAVLDLLDRAAEARLQAIEARLLADTARADLWRLAPPGLPEK